MKRVYQEKGKEKGKINIIIEFGFSKSSSIHTLFYGDGDPIY